MTDEERNQIRFLREKGYSYGQIARILNMSRNTVSSFCRREQSRLQESKKTVSKPSMEYKCCSFCQQLFLANSRRNQQFCSEKCRTNYWNRKKQESRRLAQKMTLQKGLDLSSEESDELVAKDNIVLGRKPITKS